MAKRPSLEHQQGKSVGIWIRVSTEDQVRGESPEHHERRAKLYAESREWDVKEVYHLDAISGKSVMGLPETERMLSDIRRGHITGLIFSKLARLARNTRELLEFAEIFRAQDADLISLQESIDTSSPAGRLFYTMIAAMAQWEREEIPDRVAASVPIRAKLGKPLGGAAPFGYKWDGRQLVPDAKEAPVRKRLYELFLEHRRKKTVARLMNEAGFRTRNNSSFTDTTVDRLIRDTTAKGIRRANYTKSTGDKKHWVLKPEEDWVLTEVPAIVPTDLWDQCNAILDERRANGKRPARPTVHLFSGLVFCKCGAKMYVPTKTFKYVCTKCHTKIPVDDLEAVFQEQLKGFFVSPTEILSYLEQADSSMNDKRELLETLEAERDRLASEMEHTNQLYRENKISSHGFTRT
jgi:site-specific DNA recombinase